MAEVADPLRGSEDDVWNEDGGEEVVEERGWQRGPEGWPLFVSIGEATRQAYPNGAHTVYRLDLVWDGTTSWSLHKRFRSFVSLHTVLSKRFDLLPPLPPKKWFFNLEDDFVRQRKSALDMYLKELVQRPALLETTELQSFLHFADYGIKIATPKQTRLSRQPLVQWRDQSYGFNDIQFDATFSAMSDAMLGVSVSEKASLTKKTSSLLMNIKFPWESSRPGIPIGCVALWRKLPSKAWESTSVRHFEALASCVCFLPKHDTVLVGLQTGLIKQYHLDRNEFVLKPTRDWSVHSARVTRIDYDEEEDVMLSSSRDGSVLLWDRAAQTLIDSIKVDTTSLMSAALDREHKRLFVGSMQGRVSVIDYGSCRLRCVTTLLTDPSPIRALFFDSASSILFGGRFDHTVSLWHIGKKGRESQDSRFTCMLSGGAPSRVKSVLHIAAKSLLITGHSNGMVSFYDSDTRMILDVRSVHAAAVVGLDFCASKHTFMSISRDGFINVRHTPLTHSSRFGPSRTSTKHDTAFHNL